MMMITKIARKKEDDKDKKKDEASWL
jgi:hypothetical protein